MLLKLFMTYNDCSSRRKFKRGAFVAVVALVAALASSPPFGAHSASSAPSSSRGVFRPANTTVTPTNTRVPSPSTSGRCSRDVCARFTLSLLNKIRAQYHVAPLRLNRLISNGKGTCAGAYGHSVAMARTQNLWQVNRHYPRASFPAELCTQRYTYAGQNVGVWYSGSEKNDLRMLHSYFMGTPRDPQACRRGGTSSGCNVLNPRFHQVGIGVYYKDRVTWLTEDFIG